MPLKLTKTLKGKLQSAGPSPTIGEYEDRFRSAERDGPADDKTDYEGFNNVYYDLVTDFYEYGWGRSFHFAPRVPGESFQA